MFEYSAAAAAACKNLEFGTTCTWDLSTLRIRVMGQGRRPGGLAIQVDHKKLLWVGLLLTTRRTACPTRHLKKKSRLCNESFKVEEESSTNFNFATYLRVGKTQSDFYSNKSRFESGLRIRVLFKLLAIEPCKIMSCI